MPVEVVDQEADVLALVVEDNPNARRATIDLLEANGFSALGVGSADEALKEIKGAPSFHLILSDINLDVSRPRDKSGIALARAIRNVNMDVPVIGYSSAFADEELSREEWHIFTEHFAKGASGAAQLGKHIARWKKKAGEYRASRNAWAKQELERLRAEYPVAEAGFSTLRFLIPGRMEPGGRLENNDELLRKAGYRVHVIERGVSRPLVTDDSASVQNPIWVWLKRSGDATVAEVYGYPELYSYGEEDEEAVRNLLVLMDGFYQDLRKDESASGVTARLREFLLSVFGD